MSDLHWVEYACTQNTNFLFDQDIQILRVVKLLGYTGGNRLLILERHWENTYHVSFGVEWQIADWLCLRAGYEPRPTSMPKRYFDLTFPVENLKIYSCGAGIKLTSMMDVDLSFSYLKGSKQEIPNNTSQIMNATDFTKIIYNPFAGLNHEIDTEVYLIGINFNYKW